ncbi:MAG: metallophosphoesterase [Muribaculaceae bacterium]|nr:metallophosphoesterase [Muribaculaceae bacterium]
MVAILIPRRSTSNDGLLLIMWMLFSYLTIYIPKYLYAIIITISKLFKSHRYYATNCIGLIISALVFVMLWWGALITRNSIETREVELNYSNLPKAFDNYKIVQFSDLHLGTFGNDTTFVSDVVNTINSLEPDLVVFTGDIVNRQSIELNPFTSVLSRIKARDGVFSILGNHDYGDYMDWPSQSAKTDNDRLLFNLQEKMGWKMLNNKHHLICHNSDTIVLIGVENWGDPPFKTYGDLLKAYLDLKDNHFKILLSHNSAHWRAEITDKTNIDLMLAGHTHAMQTEIDFFGYRISPAKFRYNEWGGLYNNNNQKLYVNIGLGEVAIPMRIGATPEITLITLKYGQTNNR